MIDFDMDKNSNPIPRNDKDSLNVLHDCEERIQNIAESSPMAILIYQNNKWIYANPAAECITGYSRHELSAMNFSDVVHSDFKQLVEEKVKKRQAGDKVISSYEFKIITKSGKEKWLLLHCITSLWGNKPAGLVNVLDITEMKDIHNEFYKRNVELIQKNNEIQIIMQELETINNELIGTNEELMVINEELIKSHNEFAESERRYMNIFENIPVGIFQVTVEGDLLRVNYEMARILGYISPNELMAIGEINKNFHLNPNIRHRLLEEVHSKGQVEGYKTQFQKKTGEQIWVSINSYIRNKDNGEKYLEGFIQDITIQVQTDKEVKNLEKQLLQAQKMEAMGRLAGGIAHDFNNLLTAIMGNAEISLKELKKNSAIMDNIIDILITSKRAATLTKQLLAFSRQQIIKPRVIDINEFLVNVERMLRLIIGENIKLNIIKQTELAFVKTDPSLFEQMIVNLVVNARDAIPQGGAITITLSDETIADGYSWKKRSVQAGDYIRIDVIDNGVGIDQDIMDKIFDPFFSTKGEMGTGLGLSTVYGIVKQNDGYVIVESEKGKGTKFSIFFPKKSIDDIEEKKEQSEHVIQKYTIGKETILIVEDEDYVRKLIVQTLSSQGYTVLEASNGYEALKICIHNDQPFDLILSDIVLPDISGTQLVEKVQLIRPRIRVLYMSGYAEQKITKTKVLEERDFFIPKPFLPSELQKKIREVFSNP